jgi:hypothetical protein
MKFFNSKNFLIYGGIALVVLAILGFIGITGPTPERSIFGMYWYFTNAENWAHLVLGVVALIAAYSAGPNYQMPLVFAVGILGMLVGLYGFIWSGMLLGASLENPADNLLHIVVGGWAVWAAYAERYEYWVKCRRGDMKSCDMLGYRMPMKY